MLSVFGGRAFREKTGGAHPPAGEDSIRTNIPPSVEVSQSAASGGINGVYGNRAEAVMRGMIGPQGHSDARESHAVPIPGRATVEGTQYTIRRSTTFESWHHVCAAPVGWSLSKLGVRTSKMARDVTEAADALQLQVIRGCNIFEIDGAASELHQNVARALHDAMAAFELDREGFVMIVRAGIIRERPDQMNVNRVEASNTAAARGRIVPVYERFRASSMPSVQLRTGFRISELTDDQLARLGLRRVKQGIAAGVSPDWIEAYLTNVALNTRLECIDIFLLEGLHTLFDDRDNAHIEDDILQVFAFLEKQVQVGNLQYYGISSPHLAPEVPRVYPELPPDALVPEQLRHPPRPIPTLNLRRLVDLAVRVGGPGHHFRFIEYPFNFTHHQALSTRLDYDPEHSLVSLARVLGLTALGYSPLETTNLMALPERYHNFPMEYDLKSVRMNYFTVCERAVMKEMEVREMLEKGPKTLPTMEELFVASVVLNAQRQFTNLFFFTNCMNYIVIPRFRRAVTRFKEASSAELKEWCKQYEQLVDDMLKLRRRMFEHQHGRKAAQINMAIDHFSPTLAQCPMLNQKAINFATHGCDALLSGFHISRYFHEATELNPAKNGALVIPPDEIKALCGAEEISFASASPPHPYMMEAILIHGKLSKQKSKAMDMVVEIDPKNPKFPDIPEELDESAEDNNDEEETDK
ncbi:unnamed protein product [Phytomonas sp. Hart1]|nr:unnamed protein product [Phytomonas sp. Hart1]|eukprot:CCW70166.1 unnamed protein product [Phytomonas sp. isolate Hart1]